jgi:hypothetical protein
MNEAGISTGEQLFQGILEGKVPHQVRLFAAQGLLPVSREDLLRLQVLLSADPDQELAAAATSSLKAESEEAIVEWLKADDIDPLVLDLLTRVREEDALWSVVAGHAKVSDETLRVLARNGTGVVQDIIMTNQVRIMSCLELLEDLKANSKATPVVLRRVREFEEEFIEKAIAQQIEEMEEARVSIENAIQSLRDIGAHIPQEQTMPYAAPAEDPAVRAEAEKLGLSLFGRLADMTIKEKVMVALKGSREERGILINSRSRLVVNAVLASPKLTDTEIERFAQSRSVSDEVLRIICSNRKWIRKYGVILALVQNPKAPLQQALRLLPTINHRDMGRVARNRNVHPIIRRRAKEILSQRR